ncbi:TPA: transposase [Klebsiella pneumoniae]|nr:transposase [Klebsiella pneumoniae]
MQQSLEFLVFGATGQQGGAVARALKARGKTVRAFVRDAQSDKARALAGLGIKLVVGDLFDRASIDRAMQGVNRVFSVQTSSPSGLVSDEQEVMQGKAIADSAVAANVEFLVYSSGGAAGKGLTGMGHFDSKSRIEEYIRSLPIAATITRPASFMEMMLLPGMGLNTGVFTFFMHRDQPMQMIALDDLGRINAEILCHPERYAGQYLPNAKLVIDKFHVVKMASEALEEERKNYQAQLSKEDRIYVKKSIRWLTLKRPGNLTPAEQKALEVVKQAIPELAVAYDFKEAFFCIYDEPDKQSAQNAFEAWENSLPPYGMEPFKKLVKTVHNHYDDIFAYWDAPFSITNGYTEGLNGLIKMSNRLGRGYSYDIIRAKTLYSKEARKVGSGIRAGRGKVEYGPHIPTLLKQAEGGELD